MIATNFKTTRYEKRLHHIQVGKWQRIRIATPSVVGLAMTVVFSRLRLPPNVTKLLFYLTNIIDLLKIMAVRRIRIVVKNDFTPLPLCGISVYPILLFICIRRAHFVLIFPVLSFYAKESTKEKAPKNPN